MRNNKYRMEIQIDSINEPTHLTRTSDNTYYIIGQSGAYYGRAIPDTKLDITFFYDHMGMLVHKLPTEELLANLSTIKL